jgi:membrane protein DedA with SNARE-associated domain
MEQLLAALQAHGVLAISVALFARRLGVPFPIVPFLLIAGTRIAGDAGFGLGLLAAGSLAAVAGDALWFLAGRRGGRKVLAQACRISLSPLHCVDRSERAFARHGRKTVLVAKFIPGVGGLAPPLAGALGMGAVAFLVLNALGTLLWVGSALGAGVVFERELGQLLGWLDRAGAAAMAALAILLVAYAAWLLARRQRARRAAATAAPAGEAPRIDNLPLS